jgi:lysozyme family protein
MTAYVYNAARREQLTKRWAGMKILRQKAAIDKEAKAIIAKRGIYQRVEGMTNGVPWYMVGVIDAREGGITHLGTRHLHNGDPLSGYTTHVPANRPVVGHGPPFTWLESAVDALKLKGFHNIPNWTIERVLHELEPYNGLGYFLRGIPSPYIWSCTNRYDPPYGPGGKFIADHKFDPNEVDTQVGCAPLLQRIFDLTRETSPTASPPVVVKTEPSTPTKPEPTSITVKTVGPVIATGAAAASVLVVKAGFEPWQVGIGIAIVIAVIGIAAVVYYRRK